MSSDATTITNEIQAIYPASSLQQGFIFHMVRYPLDDAYIVQSLLDYDTEIAVETYQRAWKLAIDTYPSLRLCFNWDESPVQIITKYGQLHFTFHDISTETDKDAAISRFQQTDRARGFDLTKPTLLRLHLIKQNAQRYTLLKTEHHAIGDAWSASVLLNQVHYFYQQLMDSFSPIIIEDTAYLQAQAFIAKNQSVAQTHWKKIIDTVYEPNDLNGLFTQKANTEALNVVRIAKEKNRELSLNQYERLKKLVQDEGLTLHGIVQFAWHKILHTYTQDPQTIVGTTTSGRALPIANIEKSVGLYINTLPLVVDWDNALTIKEQLQQIHHAIMELNNHSFVYLSAVQSHGNRLFNSLLLFENLSVNTSESSLLKVKKRRGLQKLNYPIALTFYLKNNTLAVNVKYDGTHLSDERVDQLLTRLFFILEQIPCCYHKPHNTMNLITAEETQQIIHDWNATDITYPNNQTLQALFEAQVSRTPDAIALVLEENALTYRQLDAKSNQLAQWLHANGLKRGELVALCLERSLEMLIGIMGVLKAGCAYVPVDPEYPLERIAYVLKNTESQFVLTLQHMAERLQPITDTVTCVALDEHAYHSASAELLMIPRVETDLAYVIYTSGTTGNPKGVAITHQGAVNRLDWMQRAYPLHDNDVVLQKTPYGFDVSVWELLWANLYGAKIVMARPDGHKDPLYLHALIEKEKVTTLHFVPSMLSAFTEALISFKMRAPNSLRYVFCSGEALLANQVAAFYSVSGDAVAVHNLYGPTEASIDVTAFDCHRAIKQVYIGKPIQNTRVYVLTKQLKPVPVGAIGELYLGGAGLAREYWRRPDLTAAAFINNPFATEHDFAQGYTRLYKTGDRVRFHSDGNIEYLGRNDAQVKIRGFRIELSEIEQVMLSYPNVLQAVALVKEHNAADQTHRFIAAYYVGSATEMDLRAHLEKHLPEYMIPRSLMTLSYFPVTRNGKLDRNALPLPSFMQEKTDETLMPRTDLEKALCAIWQNVLKVERVNITDSFFDLGGDSIRSIRVIAKMQEIGFTVSVNDVFKYKTIFELIENVDQTASATQETYVPFSLIDEINAEAEKTTRTKKQRQKSTKKRTADIMAPRNPLEIALCDIWQTVLHVPRIGITDNFFEFGGDSILGIRLLAKMQEIGFSVSVNDIFKYKTILELVENTNHSTTITQENYHSFSMMDKVVSEKYQIPDAEDIYPASYLQMGMLIESLKTQAQGTYHDVFSYRIHRPLNEALLLDIVKSLTVKHPMLRTSFMPHPDYGYVCVQHKTLDVTAHYQGQHNENVSAFIAAEKGKAISADNPGLFRLFVLNKTNDEFIFVFSFHHAITDGWSVASLMSELSTAYADETAVLHDEIIPPYQRVIQNERAALTSSECDDFWRRHLANAPMPPAQLVLHKTARLEKHLEMSRMMSDEKSSGILSAAKRLGVSPDMIFLSSYFKTLSRFCNQRDIIIGIVMNNRLEEVGGDKVFGLHLNTLPLRMHVSDDSGEMTAALFDQKTTLDAYKAYPYGKIRTDIMQARDPYTCAFNYIHFHVADAALDSRKLSAVQLFEKTTIPCTLHVSRHHDSFRISIKALNEFMDHDSAALFLDYIEHDLHAIVYDLEFSFLSTDHIALFENADTTLPAFDTEAKSTLKMPPRNQLEQDLCVIWQNVLNVPNVSVTDNFFELGGDSIRCIRLIAKMQEIEFSVSVADIFKYKTIMALVDNVKHSIALSPMTYEPFSLIEKDQRNLFPSEAVEDIYPASYFQVSMLNHAASSAETYHDVFAYVIYRPLNESRLLSVFKKLVNKHPMLRTAFVANEKLGYLCVQYAGISLSTHYENKTTQDVPALIETEKNNLLSFEKPGLFRLFTVNQTESQFTLLFSFHHAIADGWSVASLISEFSAAYANQQPVSIGSTPFFQRIIQKEQLALTFEPHKTFWRDYLAGSAKQRLTQKKHGNDAYVEVSCAVENTKADTILSTAKRLGVSVDTVFLANYFKTIAQFSNQTDVTLGIVMNNRLEETGGDTVFGLHLNILPMRMSTLEQDDKFILALADERIRLVPHKAYPYEKICLDLNEKEGLYDFAFNYTHFHITEQAAKEKIMQPIYAFEKMAIPLTLQISRYQNSFKLIIRTSDRFFDQAAASDLLSKISHY